MNEKFLEENENIITRKKNFTFEKEENEEIVNDELMEEKKIADEEFTDSNKNLEELIINKKKQKNYIILFYYEIFISIFLLINSFISFCFLNIIHILYSYLIIYNSYITNFSFRIKLEKYITISIIILDSTYLILKGSIHLYMDSKKENSNYDNDFFRAMNIFENNWRTAYDYVMNSIIVIMLIIHMIFKGYDQIYFNYNELDENIKFIRKHLKNNSGILIAGVIILCLGSSLCPSLINLLILIFGFIFFIVRIFNKKWKKYTKKYLKYFFMLIIVLSTIYNYIFSLDKIEEKLFKDNNFHYSYGITKIFDYENSKISHNASAIFSFILFYVSFFFIN